MEATIKTCICGDADCTVPYGYCHCLCQQKTNVPKKSIFARGVVKGVPMKFVHNHHAVKAPVVEEAKPFKIEGVYCRFIPLTKGLIAIVEESDYAALSKYKWQAQQATTTGMYYAITTERGSGKRLFMHRMVTGQEEKLHTDHINGDPLDNRRGNLRSATSSENQANKRMSSANRSGYIGVSWFKQYKKFVSMITHQGTRYFLGYYDLAIEAAKVRDAKAKELFGAYARLNFPNE